jgi:hypothetical protein
MKKNVVLVMVALVAALFAFKPADSVLKFDTAASNVLWKGYKVTGSHEGTVAVQRRRRIDRYFCENGYEQDGVY